MSFGQFIHVAQFYETIFCFSVLVLIGQRMVMLCRDLDDKYLKARASEFDDQIDWEKSFTVEREVLAKEREEEQRREEERKRAEEQRRKEEEEERAAAQQPKDENLRSSLVENEHDQTDRSLRTDEMEAPQRRKSLSELRKSQENSESQKAEEVEDEDSASQEKRLSSSSAENGRKSSGSRESKPEERANTVNLEESEMKNVAISESNKKDGEEPSINPHAEQTEEDRLEREYKDSVRLRYLIRIDAIFNEYLPTILSVLVVGMLSHSTYIFTMVCFFGYMFASLLFNYANLLSKLKNEPTETSIFSKVNKLIAGLFIIGLFLAYFFDSEFA